MFANGWGGEYLQEVGRGMARRAKEKDTDIFAFINYSSFAESEEDGNGESAIFRLPDLKDFDGAVLLANSFNLQNELEYMTEQVKNVKIPVISMESAIEGADYCYSDNYTGMYELTDHLIKEHKVKDIVFIGGLQDHEECISRYNAVRDAAAANKITIPEENVMFADWAAVSAKAKIVSWKEKHSWLPDAVICANDVMAVAVCDWFKDQGYRVPNDVIVTGFDYIKVGQDHIPTITSVTRNWENMGYECMDRLLAKIDGKRTETKIAYGTRLVCGESCGCGLDKYYDHHREYNMNRPMYNRMEALAVDSHLRHLYAAVRKAKHSDDCAYSLAGFFQKENWMEGKCFTMCLHQDFFDESSEMGSDLNSMATMDVICSLKNGLIRPRTAMNAKDAIFREANERATPGTYLFVPIRSDDTVYGFAMMDRDFDIVADTFLYVWSRHANQTIEQVRANIILDKMTRKLAKLSITDILTGVYNRTGADQIVYPFLEENQRRGNRSFVLMADVDGLKQINDRYGHNQGDAALQIAASGLVQGLPGDFYVIRYGGDEFLAVGKDEGIYSVEELIERIEDAVKQECSNAQIPFNLSISVGGIVLKEGESFQAGNNIAEADTLMYRMKKTHHMEMGITKE